MSLHSSTFEYLKPTEPQTLDMGDARAAAAGFARAIDALVPEGPDKTYIFRKLRELAMWINVAITRQADGTPRVDTRVSEAPIRTPEGVRDGSLVTIQEVHDDIHHPPSC